jgi:hypothetical protein
MKIFVRKLNVYGEIQVQPSHEDLLAGAFRHAAEALVLKGYETQC